MTESKSIVHPELPSETDADEAMPMEKEPKGTAGRVPVAVMVMAMVAVVLVVVLVIMNLKSSAWGGSTPKSADLSGLEAQAAALKSQLNQQRLSLGLQPLADGGEPVESIAARLKKDVDTMVGVANSFQTILAEKDAVLGAQAGKLLQSEQLRQVLAQEVTRLKTELQQSLASGSGQSQLLSELEEVKKQRDALNLELAAAKGQQSQSADVAELQRRLEETMRAKEFFETKVKQLEASQPKTEP